MRAARSAVAIGCAFAAPSLWLSAANALQTGHRQPRFVDYPAQVFAGAKAPLRLVGHDFEFKTRYRDLYRSKPDFAGHYVVDTAGCGGGCVFLLALDLKTGRVFDLDVPGGEELTDCSEEYRDAKGDVVEKGFDFRANSRLFVVTGHMPGNDCGARYFVESKGKMALIGELHLNRSR